MKDYELLELILDVNVCCTMSVSSAVDVKKTVKELSSLSLTARVGQ